MKISVWSAIALGIVALGPTACGEAPEADTGPATPEGQELIRRLFTVLRIDLAYMYAIVFAMAVKPTTDDGWTILVAAAVLVALTAIFLAPLRGGSPHDVAAATAD